ncbi:hypothetical protein Fcan01_11555 [Folsomia candida]|uniref:Uncharacterized protein n=1 Tax=Folsomia candida TaxID=158441 RepID=A0A226E9R2_FOLCA|nr:hypothetical protein Fcan01_11555 [Folsomia candida]
MSARMTVYDVRGAHTIMSKKIVGAKQSCSGWAYTSSDSNLVNPFEFGTDASNEKAYGCRVQNGNEVVPGHYSFSTRGCRIAVEGREIVATAGVFVLDNAGSANLHFQPSEGLPQWGGRFKAGRRQMESHSMRLDALPPLTVGRPGWLEGIKTQPVQLLVLGVD